jgi:hypothetical protein
MTGNRRTYTYIRPTALSAQHVRLNQLIRKKYPILFFLFLFFSLNYYDRLNVRPQKHARYDFLFCIRCLFSVRFYECDGRNNKNSKLYYHIIISLIIFFRFLGATFLYFYIFQLIFSS